MSLSVFKRPVSTSHLNIVFGHLVAYSSVDESLQIDNAKFQRGKLRFKMMWLCSTWLLIRMNSLQCGGPWIINKTMFVSIVKQVFWINPQKLHLDIENEYPV